MAGVAAGSARLPDCRPLVALAAVVVACEVVGASGSAFTAMGVES